MQEETNINSDVQPKKSSTGWIIFLVIVILLVLGVGGYFIYKAYFSKPVTDSIVQETQGSISKSLQEKMDQLVYPGSTVEYEGDVLDENKIVDYERSTSDSLAQVYNYYVNLANDNNWCLGTTGYSTGANDAFIAFRESDFRADLNFERENDKTVIIISITIGNFTASGNHNYQTVDEENTESITDASKKEITTDYVLADSGTQVVSENDLIGLTPWELKIARNEIYARHGREFVHKDLQCYFDTKSWYAINPNYSDSDLSSTEVQNVSIILDYEKKIDSPMLGKDTGC